MKVEEPTHGILVRVEAHNHNPRYYHQSGERRCHRPIES